MMVRQTWALTKAKACLRIANPPARRRRQQPGLLAAERLANPLRGSLRKPHRRATSRCRGRRDAPPTLWPLRCDCGRRARMGSGTT